MIERCHTVGDVRNHLESLYSGYVGVEFKHIRNEEERLWLFNEYEAEMLRPIPKSERINTLA